MVLDPTLLGTVDVAEGLKEDGVLLVNTSKGPSAIRQTTDFDTGQAFVVDASHIAIEEVGREITNTPMLGAFARATGLVDLEEMADKVREWFGYKLSNEAIEGNVRAMRRAAEELQKG